MADTVTVNDVLAIPAAGRIATFPGYYVQFVNNATSTAYVSAATDVNGNFQVTCPVGLYTVSTATTPAGPWVPTGNTAYPATDPFDNSLVLHLAGVETATGVKTWSGDQYFGSGRPWTDPMANGADPTGGTDSTGDVPTSNPALIRLPAGTFSVSSLNIPVGAVGLKIEGAGRGLTTLKANTSGAKVIDVFANNVEIADLTVDGNNLAAYGICLEDQAYFWKLTNVKVINCTVSPGIGIGNVNHAYSGHGSDVICTANTIGVQLIKLVQYSTFTHLQSYNNTSINVQVGDGSMLVLDIEFDKSQVENDTFTNVDNFLLNWCQVRFTGYCEADNTGCSDFHIVGGAGELTQLKASYYSNGSNLASQSILINQRCFIELENCYIHGFATATIVDTVGGASKSDSTVIRKNTYDNGLMVPGLSIASGGDLNPGTPIVTGTSFEVSNSGIVQAQIGSLTNGNVTGNNAAIMFPTLIDVNVAGGGSSWGFNAYYSGGWKYARAAAAAVFGWDATNGWLFKVAPSGAANAAITFTQAFQANASGDLIAGRTIKPASGATGSRPSAATVGAGAIWYDTTLGQSIVSNGTSWVTDSGVVYTPSLTGGSAPTAVAANTTAEQTFTVTGLTVGQSVAVNGPAPTAGTGIVGARVSATNTLAITFVNATSGSLTPASGTYTVRAT